MGTRGLVGFISKGVRKGTYNHFDSYPSGLGDDIIKFILACSDEELKEMASKVEQVSFSACLFRLIGSRLISQLEWLDEDQVKRLQPDTRLHLHFPEMPWFRNDYILEYDALSDEARLEAFKTANPNSGISDDEIMRRYIPAYFSQQYDQAQKVLSWIPEYDEVIQATAQHDLLERIWDGRQKHVVEDSDFTENGFFNDYANFIDFDNRVMEVEGVIDGTLEIAFDDLKVGIIDEMMVQCSEDQEKMEEE